ncbi:outer membrane autotransporter protein [Anaerospora hongkongensis]|uniref:Outer membrane autotransporter protein n=1 Tax=Anaerospora hongkongensis TaxID=244830 RepID=A0A4R1Q3E0_9FIRM|nr:TonB-dependent receptor [Anaerospora hongkongensis]TCL39263.1 outer membrane autotransporter protein [Anaerospora hongkongensis]
MRRSKNHKKNRQCRNHKLAKKALILSLVLTSIYSYNTCTLASPSITGEVVDQMNWGGNTNQASLTFTVDEGTTLRTYGRSSQIQTGYRATIILGKNSTWRPLEATDISNTSMPFIMNDGAAIDLAYKYSADNGYTEENGYNTWSTIGTSAGRRLTLRNGQFGDNLTFRINLDTKNSSLNPDGTWSASTGYTDSVILRTPQLIDTAEDATSHITVDYTIHKNFAGYDWTNTATLSPLLKGKVDGVFQILYSDVPTMDKFIVTGSSQNDIDAVLNKYVISTELLVDSSDTTSKNYSVYWSAQQQEFLSQGAYSAANAALSTRNLWRIEDGLFWKRGDDRRFANRSIDQNDFSDREGVWANTWRGKYSYDGIQNSSFGQTYSGIQVGYDKLRDRELFGGKFYTGLFFSKMTSDADFYAQNTGGADYNSGKGDLDSDGLGAYMLWVGNKGHYLDTTVRWSKIGNEYTYTDSFGDSYRKDFTAKTYGLGARYGLRVDKGNGWFIEPQIGLSYGVMRSFDFRQDNGLKYAQDKMDMLIGRAGLSIGKRYGQGDHTGEAYFKLSANHDFMDGGNAMMYAMQNSTNPDLAQNVLASQKVDTLAGKDTWYDVTLGSNFKLGDSRNGWLEVNKSFGGKVDTDWQINGGIAWHWGGPSRADKAVYRNRQVPGSFSMNQAEAAPQSESNRESLPVTAAVKAGAVTGSAQEIPASVAVEQNTASGSDRQITSRSNLNTFPKSADIGLGASSTPDGTGTTGALHSGETGGFTLEPVVVEAARPDWEKKLSPGTVSVIEVAKYEGEHKTLGDLLQTVPGVYIDKLSGGGTGHYTTVRVRGSSASQVNIYMDGVLVNTGSEQAVNLENLNIDNVERIEVYRGYIPARFAGAAMGGAINIVTKKPDQTGGKVSYGLRSFGGQKFNLETTAPVGEGSLLLAVNHDEATGDFRYNKHLTQDDVTKWEIINGKTYPVETLPMTRWRQNNGYENNNILAKWQDDNWFVKLNYINNKTHTPQAVGSYLADVPQQYWPNSFDSAQRAMYGGTVDTEKTELSFGRRQQTGNVEWGWKLGTIHQDKQSLWARYGTGQRDFVFGTNTFRNDTYSASMDGTWKMGEHHLLEFLATGTKETMKVKFDADQFSNQNWKDDFEAAFLPKYDMSNYYLQLQDTMKLDDTGSLIFTPLVRAQKANIGIEVMEGEGWLYSYNLGLKKQLNDKWTTWATYGTYHRLPSWYEVFGDGVNLVSKWKEFNSAAKWSPETSAEHGQNWDVSVNRNGKLLGTDNDTTVTYFQRDSENLLTTVFNPLTGATWYANYGAGKIQGVELSSKMHWEKIDFTLSTTWQDSLITKGYKAYDNMSNAAWQDQPFPWTPEWSVNARVDYRFPGDKFSVFGEYNWTDKLYQYNNTGKGAYYDALGLFNIGMKYSFNKQFKLIAGINDVANKGPDQMLQYPYTEGPNDPYPTIDKTKNNVAYPQQGRTYYMTVEYTF